MPPDYSEEIKCFMQSDPFCPMDEDEHTQWPESEWVIDDGNYDHDQENLWYNDDGYHMYGD